MQQQEREIINANLCKPKGLYKDAKLIPPFSGGSLTAGGG